MNHGTSNRFPSPRPLPAGIALLLWAHPAIAAEAAPRAVPVVGLPGAAVLADPLSFDALQNSATRAAQRGCVSRIKANGLTSTMHSVLVEPPSGRLLGYYAEEFMVAGDEGWNRVRKANAPQNDLWRRIDGRLEGNQVKFRGEYRFHEYRSAMHRDHLAEHFAVVDDHVDRLRSDLLAKARESRATGLVDEAARLERHAARVRPIGATRAGLERNLLLASARGLCTSAAATATVTAGTAIVIDLALLGVEAMDGSMSGAVLEERILDAVVKSAVTGTVTAVLVVCGSNPVGWVVVIGGATAYLATEGTLVALKEVFRVPGVADDAIPYLLSGWRETSYP